MPQCKGTTKRGTRCLRTVKKGETYCSQHKSKRSSKKSSQKRGCKSQSAKKYTRRSSPPYPANLCCHKVMLGNDGNKYKSVMNVNGVCRWIKLK